MRSRCQVSVAGGNTHILAKDRLTALQSVVENLGAPDFPIFLRLGAVQRAALQPVTARALLAELELSARRMEGMLVPGVRFLNAAGEFLGALFMRPDGGELAASPDCSLAVTPRGIRIVVSAFPPPVGFRSDPGLERGRYACFFQRLSLAGGAWQGIRTEEMGGSGAPVALPKVPVPPATRWDLARVAGAADVTQVEYVETPVPEAFRDILHALESACADSLRLKRPLEIRFD